MPSWCPNPGVDVRHGLLWHSRPAHWPPAIRQRGHTLPYRRTCEAGRTTAGVRPPLGLFPEASYETFETTIEPGECVLFLSDGMTESAQPGGRNVRRRALGDALINHRSGQALLDHLLHELAEFVGPGWSRKTMSRC